MSAAARLAAARFALPAAWPPREHPSATAPAENDPSASPQPDAGADALGPRDLGRVPRDGWMDAWQRRVTATCSHRKAREQKMTQVPGHLGHATWVMCRGAGVS
jgi:hypothetical protein